VAYGDAVDASAHAAQAEKVALHLFDQRGGGGGSTTISSVAIGPIKSEISHHSKPLRFLAWANPALISESDPQPTK
jgi:hypothetical protein